MCTDTEGVVEFCLKHLVSSLAASLNQGLGVCHWDLYGSLSLDAFEKNVLFEKNVPAGQVASTSKR